MSGAFSPLALALVALGGAAGSVLRYLVAVQSVLWFGLHFPWGTLAVNAVGSAVIGVLGALPLPQEARLLLTTGLLGGFTTFSAFSLEVALLWQRAPWTAVLYVALSLALDPEACSRGDYVVGDGRTGYVLSPVAWNNTGSTTRRVWVVLDTDSFNATFPTFTLVASVGALPAGDLCSNAPSLAAGASVTTWSGPPPKDILSEPPAGSAVAAPRPEIEVP